jgi:hypothetical protein
MSMSVQAGKRAVAVLFGVVVSCAAFGIEVSLNLEERAGFARRDNHVNSGFPLPEGACKDVSRFALYGQDGKPVPASFVVRERWLKDDSVRFATVHFSTDMAAGEMRHLVARDDGKGAVPARRISVTEAGSGVTVDTGAVRFSISVGEWRLFDEVFSEGRPVVEPRAGKVVFRAEYGRTPVQGGEATPPPLGEFRDAQAVVKTLAVEENAPARVVVLATGSFQEAGADKLDFQARYYAVAGSASVRVVVTVVNRQGKAWDEFVGIRAFGFELPARTGGGNRYALGASEGEDLSGPLGAGETVALLQPSSLAYEVIGKTKAGGKCREIETRRVGWINLSGKDAGVTAAVRWFWQLHPKGLEATGDGAVKVWLVPFQAEKATVPAGEYSEPLARIDLYTGAAKTHEMLFSFGKPTDAGHARAAAMGVMEPLFAACAPEWYCQKTWGFDRIYDARIENYRPEARELIRKYEETVDRGFASTMMRLDGKGREDMPIKFFLPPGDQPSATRTNRLWCTPQKCEEYGILNFGSHAEHNSLAKENDALNTQWDGNYYDFPRACLIRFVRTGMYPYFDAAQQAALHLADQDMAHWHPGDPKLNGIERTCPSAGHVRQWWSGRPFGVSGNVDSAKSQSLYELYCLTGDAWYRQAGLLSADYLSVHGGGALRAQGNRMTGLWMAVRQTRDGKYRNAWEAQAAGTAAAGIGTQGTRLWDQAWMYGLACEALYNRWMDAGDTNALLAVRVATDSLIYGDKQKTMGASKRGEYNGLAGFTVNCPGYAYELTGDAAYLKYGVERLIMTAENGPGRSKSFAQHARMSPQFLRYLAVDYVPPKPVLGDRQKADAVEPALREMLGSR